MKALPGKKKKSLRSSPPSCLIRNVEGSYSTINEKTNISKTLSKVTESENFNLLQTRVSETTLNYSIKGKKH